VRIKSFCALQSANLPLCIVIPVQSVGVLGGPLPCVPVQSVPV
jgi:hypothetical protein